MSLPASLQQAIESEVGRFLPSDLKRAAGELSDDYRADSAHARPPLRSDLHRAAYLAARLPATFGAVTAALQQAWGYLETAGIQTVLDLGAGPGTAAWALASMLPGLERVTFVEKDASMVHIGKRLASASRAQVLRDALWLEENLAGSTVWEPHDVVLTSYALSELQEGARASVLSRAWNAAKKTLVMVETGTPVGFSQLRQARQWLIAAGAYVVAPCPQGGDCPIAGSDWCHFSARIQRSKLHRYLKSGEHGHEDEKFSYLVVSRSPVRPLATGRILRHPQFPPGSVRFTLCTEKGRIETAAVQKQTRDLYKRARKSGWGDPWGDRKATELAP